MSGTPSQTRFGCYIGNIDRSVTVEMLKQVFGQCGTIIDCSLNGREGDPYRFGFIDFVTEDDRARAMKYNGFTLVGRKLKVGVSKGNVNKPEGFTNGNSGAGGFQRSGSRHFNNGQGGYGMGMPDASGLTPQQQMEAQLLLRFLQEGKMDARQLSPAQQQLLIVSLNQANAAAGISNHGNGSGTPPQQPPSMGDIGLGMGSSAMPQQQMMNDNSNSTIGGGGGLLLPHQNVVGAAGMPITIGAPSGMSVQMGQGCVDMMGAGYGGVPARPSPQPQTQPWGSVPMGGQGMYPPMMPMMSGPSQPLPQHQPMYVGGGGGAGGVGGGVTAPLPAPVASAATHRGTTVNPPPSPDTLRLRERQREQFFEVVRKETEKYEKKVREKQARAAAGGGGEGDRSGDSSASDDEGTKKAAKKSKK